MAPQHIDHALVAKSHPRMYLLHKWWARKPHNVVRTYIETYTKPGDVVLDPFLGSGPAVLEAVKAGRRGMGFDLDPLSVFIARMTAIPIDMKVFKAHFDGIRQVVQNEIEALYVCDCPAGHGEVPITHVIWADEYQCASCGKRTLRGDTTAKETVNKCECGAALDAGTRVSSEMLEIGYACPTCLGSNPAKRFLIKTPDAGDQERLAKIDKRTIPAWVPDDPFYYPDGRPFQKKERSERVTDLFDHRALIALSLLFQAIDALPDGPEKEVLKLCFSSNLHSVSKLNMVHGLRWKKGMLPSRAWVIHSFYVPPLRIEFPVWFYFEERFKDFLAGKEQTNAEVPAKEAKSAKALLAGTGNFYVNRVNVIDLDDALPEASVDYVFTDPPYGGAIQYLELSTLYTAWLKGPRQENFDMDFKDEITINPNQKKSFDYYHQMLRAAFDNVFKVLKPNAYLTVTFHSTDIKVWNSILEAINLAGFEMEKVIYQPPPVKSIKSMMQPYGSAQGDYYIRFHKPKVGRISGITKDEDLYEKVIVTAATHIIAKRGEPTPLTIILNGIVTELRKANGLLRGSTPIVDVLKKHLKTDFRLVNALDDKGKIVGAKWWLEKPASVPFLDRIPLEERVESAVLETLGSKIKVSFDEILQDVFIRFPNAFTPDRVSIQTVLKEYAEKAGGAEWRLNPEVKIRESEHSTVIRALAELGKKLGLKVWVGQREQSDHSEGIRLGDLCDDKKLALPGIGKQAMDRVRMIDVIWYDDAGKIDSIFEVENTTGVTEGLIRGSNIPDKCKRYLVLPEERQPLMRRKLSEPAFKDLFDVDAWEMIFYSPLLGRWRQTQNRKKIARKEFRELVHAGPLDEKGGHPTLFDLA